MKTTRRTRKKARLIYRIVCKNALARQRTGRHARRRTVLRSTPEGRAVLVGEQMSRGLPCHFFLDTIGEDMLGQPIYRLRRMPGALYVSQQPRGFGPKGYSN